MNSPNTQGVFDFTQVKRYGPYTVTIRHLTQYRITVPDVTTKCAQFTVPYEPNLRWKYG